MFCKFLYEITEPIGTTTGSFSAIRKMLFLCVCVASENLGGNPTRKMDNTLSIQWIQHFFLTIHEASETKKSI